MPARAIRRLEYESCVSFCAGGRAVLRDRRPVVAAQQPAPAPKDPQAAKPEQKPEPKPDQPAEQPKYEETVVVSASRNEEKLINAPATMTRHRTARRSGARRPRTSPSSCAPCPASTSRRSPRATSTSPRAARPARSSTGTLALLDGRSLYQDFFGFVMWDFLPVNLNEIKQIEVIRGPASAVWGANALNGVVNVITKSPREMQGTSAILGVGGFDRRRRHRQQHRVRHALLHQRHARAGGQRSRRVQDLGRRLHAGSVWPADRHHPVRPRRGLRRRRARHYPAFTNQGTTQPKFDARVDYDYADGQQADRSRAASPAPTASCTPASGPSTSTAAR